MAIYFNSGTDRYPLSKLALVVDKLSNTDCIEFTDCVVVVTESVISILGILGDNCLGIENYKDKAFKAPGNKVLLKIHWRKKDVWDKDTSSYKSQATHPDEDYLYTVISERMKKVTGMRFSLTLKPWVNPMMEQFVAAGTPESLNFADAIFNGILQLSPIDASKSAITDAEVDELSQSKGGKRHQGGTKKLANKNCLTSVSQFLSAN